MNRPQRYVLILIVVMIIIQIYGRWVAQQRLAPKTTVTYQEFLKHMSRNEINDVNLQLRNTLTFTLKGPEFKNMVFTTVIPNIGADDKEYSIAEILKAHPDIKFTTRTSEPFPAFAIFLIAAVLGALSYHLYMKSKEASIQGSIPTSSLFGSSFTKARVTRKIEGAKRILFADVAGVDEAIVELQEIVEYIKNPAPFIQVGADMPKGVLLIGPPGCGKTLLAKAVAGEAGVPFFSMSGSEFIEMFVGVGAGRVRNLFGQAKRAGKAVIFIDEIEVIGGKRGMGLGTGSEKEQEQTLGQLLVEMDGFEGLYGIVVLAATNRPDMLDPALLRPGRFDRKIVVGRPDVRGREAILKIHSQGKPLARDINLKEIASKTPGFVGADLKNLINEAALLAARRKAKSITQQDLEQAIDRVVMGPERKGFIIPERERRATAIHEGGHVVVMFRQWQADPENADPPRKVSIIPRDMALGVTVSYPQEDRFNPTERYIVTKITELFGGRVAEEIILGQRSIGAKNDFDRATELAENMILEWGMGSGDLPPRTFRRDVSPFLGGGSKLQANVSDETAARLETEVAYILNDCYARARNIIENDREALDRITQALLEHETLSAEEIHKLMGEREQAFYGRILEGIGAFLKRIVRPLAKTKK